LSTCRYTRFFVLSDFSGLFVKFRPFRVQFEFYFVMSVQTSISTLQNHNKNTFTSTPIFF
jgi:hypothetical protein